MAQINIHFMGLDILLVRKKNVKNLYVKIKEPDYGLKIIAPVYVSQSYIKEFVSFNYSKIVNMREKHIENTKKFIKTYEEGEIQNVWGKPYSLNLKESKKKRVYIKDQKIIIEILEKEDFAMKAKLLKGFYRKELYEKVSMFVNYYCKLMDLDIPEYRVKDMKTRWGSCNTIDKRIWLSLKLALYPEHCLEYVVVHELAHLIERKHNKTFYNLVERYYPNWREAEIELNSKARKI